jgi:hypothetical protein
MHSNHISWIHFLLMFYRPVQFQGKILLVLWQRTTACLLITTVVSELLSIPGDGIFHLWFVMATKDPLWFKVTDDETSGVHCVQLNLCGKASAKSSHLSADGTERMWSRNSVMAAPLLPQLCILIVMWPGNMLITELLQLYDWMYSLKIIFSYTLEGHRSLAKAVTFGKGTGQMT